jgi:hypothetical protein
MKLGLSTIYFALAVSDTAKIWDTAVESKSDAFIAGAKTDVRDDGIIAMHVCVSFIIVEQ